MLKLKLVLLFASCTLFACAQQDIKDYTLQNIRAVKTIDPDSNDYNDLEAVGKAIGNARIVMLGEQDHGDAPSFLAKTRMIKYLHEKLGFDVLVFESDFWALNQVWNQLNKPGFNTDSIRDNTYNIWAHCVQVQSLYSYINTCSRGAKPLIVAGMDCRHAGPYSKLAYVGQFDSLVLRREGYKGNEAVVNRFKTMLSEVIKSEYDSHPGKADKLFFLSVLDTLSATNSLDAFWKQELVSLRAYVINAWMN